MHMDGHSHSLFVEGRLSMITVSILRRKRYPFNDMRWKTIPWLKQPKSPQDLLIHILGEIPALLEDTDTAILQKDSQKAAVLEKVLGECWKINDQLKWWLENIGPESLAAHTLQAQELPSSSAANNTAADHKMRLYWAAHLSIHATIWLILRSNQPKIQINENHISHQSYPELYCMNIIETARRISNPLVDAFE
ncbi:unnamed protein product [Clonostachys rhizophaga]|uniref:Uncharacterized protein n=1 Tax=Clonostachys rhizophaga TaxID=160324 RepID=A0A9N9VVP5_9HYPO|nr:unnamed protein product [Clonostachys rhizophaga]